MLTIPDSWSIDSSILHDSKDMKIGELTSKKSWSYATGDDFIKDFRNGVVGDSEDTEFIKSGNEGKVYWVCRLSDYEDGKGGFGMWYVRRFWVNGPILTLYSYKGCEENFAQALEIAKTLSER